MRYHIVILSILAVLITFLNFGLLFSDETVDEVYGYRGKHVPQEMLVTGIPNRDIQVDTYCLCDLGRSILHSKLFKEFTEIEDQLPTLLIEGIQISTVSNVKITDAEREEHKLSAADRYWNDTLKYKPVHPELQDSSREGIVSFVDENFIDLQLSFYENGISAVDNQLLENESWKLNNLLHEDISNSLSISQAAEILSANGMIQSYIFSEYAERYPETEIKLSKNIADYQVRHLLLDSLSTINKIRQSENVENNNLRFGHLITPYDHRYPNSGWRIIALPNRPYPKSSNSD